MDDSIDIIPLDQLDTIYFYLKGMFESYTLSFPDDTYMNFDKFKAISLMCKNIYSTVLTTKEKEVVGYILILAGGKYTEECKGSIPDEKNLILFNFCVQPKYRGNNYGKLLIHYLITQKHSESEIEVLTKEDNKVAIGLYEMFGFTKVKNLKDYYSQSKIVGSKNAILYKLV